MPITITKRILSGSTHGQGIMVTATQGAVYNSIHVNATATTTLDELWLYAQNDYSQAVELVLELGVSQSGAQVAVQVPSRDGPALVVPGLLLTGSACGVVAFVAGLNGSASPAISGSALVSVFGYVNRMVQT